MSVAVRAQGNQGWLETNELIWTCAELCGSERGQAIYLGQVQLQVCWRVVGDSVQLVHRNDAQ